MTSFSSAGSFGTRKSLSCSSAGSTCGRSCGELLLRHLPQIGVLLREEGLVVPDVLHEPPVGAERLHGGLERRALLGHLAEALAVRGDGGIREEGGELLEALLDRLELLQDFLGQHGGTFLTAPGHMRQGAGGRESIPGPSQAEGRSNEAMRRGSAAAATGGGWFTASSSAATATFAPRPGGRDDARPWTAGS